MGNKLSNNYKSNKLHLDMMNKIKLLDDFADKGMLVIDEEKHLLLIRSELFVCVCRSEAKYRHFLNNVLMWIAFEQGRKGKKLENEYIDFNVIGKEGMCVVVGRYDGQNLQMIPYEEVKEKLCSGT